MGPEAQREAMRKVWAMLKRGATSDEAIEALVQTGWSEETAHDITVRSVTSRWNWGGVFFGWSWLIGNRCWAVAGIMFVTLLLASVALSAATWHVVGAAVRETPLPEQVAEQVSNFLGITAQVFLPICHLIVGYMGGRWSWGARKYESLEQFRQTQNVWADCVFVFAALGAITIVAEGLIIGWGPTLTKYFLH